MTTRCPSCGFDNPDDHRFCGRCGTDFGSTAGTWAPPGGPPLGPPMPPPGPPSWTVALVPNPQSPPFPQPPTSPPSGPLAPPAPRKPLSSAAIGFIALGIVFALAILGVVLGQMSSGL